MEGIMRSKKYWGPDAEVFVPERWLEAGTTASCTMHNTLDVLWTLGRYTSLGGPVAQTVLNKTFPEVGRFPPVCLSCADRGTNELAVAASLRFRSSPSAAPPGYQQSRLLDSFRATRQGDEKTWGSLSLIRPPL